MSTQRKAIEKWWSQQEADRIAQLRRDGWTRREIAAELGLSFESLRRIIKYEGMARSRASYVASGRELGGVVMVTIGPELHRRLADMCRENRESMNKCADRLIRAAVERHERTKREAAMLEAIGSTAIGSG